MSYLNFFTFLLYAHINMPLIFIKYEIGFNFVFRDIKQIASMDILVVQLLNGVQLLETPSTAAHQASLSFTITWSLLKLMFIESLMPSNHLILRHPFLLLLSVFLSIRVFSNESALRIRWPKY